jgi:predicted membrane chloride channel (bestrophin family)
VQVILVGRWGLALRAAPLVAAIAAAKLVLSELGWEWLSVNPLYASLVAATVFLFGFLLAGTLADYKESERLPGELAVSLEAIADECLILYESNRASAARECLEHLQRLAGSLRGWFYERERTETVLDSIAGLNRFFLAFEELTQPNFIVRLKQEQTALRRVVTRIHTIRETSFVGAGYAIAELASVLLLGALLVTDVASLAEELLVVSTIAFLLIYMILLIRDLDDPFGYASKSSVADVSLHPLDQLNERVDRSLAELPQEAPVAGPTPT